MLRHSILVVLAGANAIWALTGGPSQPEYTGFTPSQKSGLVDLYSGDFSYSIPLMTVPGPGFNYPIVLGYRAGITMDQASSWVGLGWSLNAGSVNRALNKYPDDYLKGRAVNVLDGEEAVSGFDVGVAYMGIGLTVGQRSDHGFHGGLDVSVAGFDVGGLEFNQSDGFGMREMSSLGDQFAGALVGKAAGSVTDALNGQMNALLGTQGLGLSVSPTASGLNVSVAGVGFGSSSISSGAFHNVSNGITIPVLNTGVTVSFSASRAWIHKKDVEQLYGYLNLSNYPREASGSDYETKNHKMEYSWAPDQSLTQAQGNGFQSWILDMFFNQKAFVVSTSDGFQAKAEGMSMSFRPYRQDIGDYYGQERLEAQVGYWLNLVNKTWLRHLPVFGRMTREDKEAYDRSLGINATRFVHQVDDPTIHQAADYHHFYDASYQSYPVAVFRETGTSGGTFLGETWRPRRPASTARCNSAECELDYRFRTNGMDATRGYLQPNIDFIPGDTPEEYPDRISGGSGVFPIFKKQYNADGIDPAYCSPLDESPQCDPAVPLRALIGFTLVRPDGMVYEYHKPAFNWSQMTISVSRPEEPEEEGAYDFGKMRNASTMSRAYASSWLLTAIKAPDYVDMGMDGPSAGDMGSWVSFEYVRHARNFNWRTPYDGFNPLGVGKDEKLEDQGDEDGGSNGTSLGFESYGQVSLGSKEIYYLDRIITPTHQARFFTSPKDDGLESGAVDGAEYVPSGSIPRIRLHNMLVSPNDVLEIDYIRQEPGENGCFDLNRPDPQELTGEFQVVNIGPISERSGNAQEFELLKNNGAMHYPFVQLNASLDIGECGKIEEVRLKTRASTNQLAKLDRVELRRLDDNQLLNVAEFKYEALASKQLTPGVPDVPGYDPNATNPKGKLTLREVVLGDGTSELPPYKFTYFMEGAQAKYHRLHWDRWGFYKRDGGLVDTEILRGHVIDWALLFDVLNGTTNPVHAYARTALEGALNAELDDDDYADLKAVTSLGALKEAYKVVILKALNRIKNDPGFYAGAVAAGASPGPGSVGGKSQPWATRARTGIGAGAIITTSGQVRASPPLSEEELNILHGLNMSVMVERVLKQATPARFVLFRDLSINRFDHETNPEDVKAWSLKQVVLPSGGKMSMEYESDDFVYSGRSRIMELADADKFMETGTLEYYRNIGSEKSVYSQSSLLKISEETMGEGFSDRPDQVKLRVSSLFQVYKKNADGQWVFTEQFEKLWQWQQQGATGDNHKIHLLGWYDPTTINQNVMSGSICGYVFAKENGGTSAMNGKGFLSSFDLGPINEAFDLRQDATPEWKEQNQCQRRHVDFTLADLNFTRLEAANKGPSADEGNCGAVGNTKTFLEKVGYLTLGWGRRRDQRTTHPDFNKDWPKFLVLETELQDNAPVLTKYVKTWTPDGLPPDWTVPPSLDPEKNHMFSTAPSMLTQPCASRRGGDGTGDECTITYHDGSKWVGPGSWDNLQEFSTRVKNDDWGFMSFNIGKLIQGGVPVAHAAGVPGGGIRVKRLSYNSGWPQRPGEPPLTHVTEYAYDCSGANGGVYSSGATPSLPPPYNNKGDDRVTQAPQVSLVEGGPFVGYRRVTEIRPGRGKIVYDFLSPADIGDFITYDNCNSANIVNGEITDFQAGCYDSDHSIYWSEMNHARWKLHRLSHFQGLMTGKAKYSQNKVDGQNEMVAEERYRFLTSLTSEDLGEVALTSLLNNSDALGSVALKARDKEMEGLYGGTRDYPFTVHPTSQFMGRTMERFRHRWFFKQDNTSSGHRNRIGLNEMETIEHSIRQFELITKVQGVGTKTVHSYFDYLTGEPLVTTVTALKEENGASVEDTRLPVKTTVIVPAHWIPEYNPGPETEPGTISMGPVSSDVMFKQAALNDLYYRKVPADVLTSKNMLTQNFSQSLYSGLGPYQPECPVGQPACEVWIGKLQGANIMNRSLTTWKRFDQSSGNAAWRMDESFSLRLPMARDPIRVIEGPGTIEMPWPSGPIATVDAVYRSNPAYVMTSRNIQYGDLGEVLESADANDVRVSSFYQGHKLLVGQVLNSDRASCAVLTMDELATTQSLNPVWQITGATLATDRARSGGKSLRLADGADKLILDLPAVKGGRMFEYTIWLNSPNTLLGSYRITVDGAVTGTGAISNSVDGTPWQKHTLLVDLGASPGAHAVRVEIGRENGTGGVWYDDARFAPQDAQVYTMTYNGKGLRDSEAGPNDILSRYHYDAFGRLMEVKDHQGVLVSTQAEMEAK